MTLFLRNSKNETIVDIEVSDKDLSSVVVIETYSKLLLSQKNKEQVIKDFSEIDELKGWYFEVFLETNPNPTKENLIKILKIMLTEVAEKYNLSYVED